MPQQYQLGKLYKLVPMKPLNFERIVPAYRANWLKFPTTREEISHFLLVLTDMVEPIHVLTQRDLTPFDTFVLLDYFEVKWEIPFDQTYDVFSILTDTGRFLVVNPGPFVLEEKL